MQAHARARPIVLPLGDYSHSELVKHCLNSPTTDPVWIEFYQRFDPWIKCYLSKAWKPDHYNSSNNTSDLLQEFIQEVYVMLLKDDCHALRSYRGITDSSFLAYLSAICVNVVREYLRKQSANKRRARFISWEHTLSDPQARKCYLKALYGQPLFNAEKITLAELLRKQLWQRINAILKHYYSDRDRKIFLLTMIDGYSSVELSQMKRFHLKATGIESVVRKIYRALIEILTAKRAPRPRGPRSIRKKGKRA